jgi:2-isopropylmalate synthase
MSSRQVDEILNRQPNRHAPFVGASAFATKAGIHASAVLKDPRTYEHVEPDAVGNARKVLVSDQGGRSNILAELKRIGIAVDKDDPRVGRVLEEVKRREAEAMPSRARMPPSTCSRAGCWARCPPSSTWSASP